MGVFLWMVFVENRTPKEIDTEEQDRGAYSSERDDGISKIFSVRYSLWTFFPTTSSKNPLKRVKYTSYGNYI